MDTLLEAIDVCNVDGFCFGNYTDEEAGTGCTVIVAPEGATGGVDVRGGAPASRETDLLRPENTVDKVHAVCLSGGSAFGLEAASGVARELESRGIGLPVGPTQVPIVCSSCIFDLAFGDPTVRPDIEAGIAAVREALDHTPTKLEQGNVASARALPWVSSWARHLHEGRPWRCRRGARPHQGGRRGLGQRLRQRCRPLHRRVGRRYACRSR